MNFKRLSAVAFYSRFPLLLCHSLRLLSIVTISLIGLSETAIAQSTDYGDAPNSYGDASHDISTFADLYLGNSAPDSEADTQLTSSPSTGDDDDEGDDEDAFVALPNVPLIDPSVSDLSLGRKYSLKVPVTNNTNGDATLHAWIDFNQNGKFEAGEYTAETVTNIQDSVSLSWNIPLSALVGDTHARFRLTKDDLGDNQRLLDFLNLPSTGLLSTDETILNLLDGIDGRSVGKATDGEVEDYPVSIAVPLFDYGDAPDANSGTESGDYQTTRSDGGPSHIVVDTLGLNFSLGNNVDGDNGSLQSDSADADDLDTNSVDLLGTLIGGSSTNLNDEDGVDIANLPTLTADAGQTYTVPVTVRNNIPLLDGFIVGYIDFNRDGDFEDAGEKSTTAIAPAVTSVSASASIDGSSSSASGSVDNTGLRTVNVSFTVPSGVTPGNTYARFRLGSVRQIVESATVSTSSNGEINNGEIEDYQIAIAAATNTGNNATKDYGDAPDSYRDASHDLTVAPGLYLGKVAPDGEADTQLTSAASAGDDDDEGDDEDAFVFLPNVPLIDPNITELSVGRNYNLTVPLSNTTNAPATLHAWIDFNQNGKFEAEEHRAVPVPIGQTSVELSWDLGGILGFLNLLNLPLTTFVGDTHARFRLTSEELTDDTGVLDVLNLGIDERAYGDAADGEVEDYPVNITAPLYDYGDAPDTGTGTATGNYQTTEGDGGPTHIVIKDPLDLLHLSLGNTVDGDDGSLQANDANADDTDTKDIDILNTVLSNNDTGLDDEDGIANFPSLIATPGQTYTVPVTVRNNIPLLNAYLVGYIDFNRDGDFDDPGEKSATVTVASDLLTIAPDRVALDTSGAPRTFNVTFTVPAGVVSGSTYARFRLGSIKEIVESATTVSVSSSNGEINNGEVEDYQIAIAPTDSAITSIGGQLIDDTNYNGVRDEGETGRAGVTIELFDSQTQQLQASTTTSDNGFYDFGDLPGGEYYLEIKTPDNTVLVAPNQNNGNNKGIQSKFNRVTNRTKPFTFQTGQPIIFDSAIGADTDGDMIADANEQGDRDGDGVADNQEVDPEGFFYDEATGKILTGGSISVTGPSQNSVDLRDDGADGSYQFFAREAGTYTINVNSPPGYEPSTICTATPGSFDPTGGSDPTSLGSGENGNTGYLVDYDCENNVFYLVFELEENDPFVINNNLPFKKDPNFTKVCNGKEIVELSFENPVLESGSNLQIGATYRFSNVAAGIDALVTVDAFNNGATLLQIDNAVVGVGDAFQPSLSAVENADSSVDFTITWVRTQTDAPIAIQAFDASGIDIDGNSVNLREYIELEKLSSYTLENLTDLTAVYNNPTARFESKTTDTQPNISIDATTNIATAKYNNVSSFRYRIGAIDNSTATTGVNLQRLNSLSFQCIDFNNPQNNTTLEPNLLLIKRITAIDRVRSGEETQFNNFVDDPNSTDDNHLLWPDSDGDRSNNINLYLRGAIDGGEVEPGDEIEYTIYFLSNGDAAVREASICDAVPNHLHYLQDTYGTEVGMALGFSQTNLPISPNKYLSNLLNDDEGDFYGAGTSPPANLCKKVDSENNLVTVDGSNNDNGAIIIRPAASLAPATSSGQPASYGFVRFRGKVK